MRDCVTEFLRKGNLSVAKADAPHGGGDEQAAFQKSEA
jgi:hypothetical protein